MLQQISYYPRQNVKNAVYFSLNGQLFISELTRLWLICRYNHAIRLYYTMLQEIFPVCLLEKISSQEGGGSFYLSQTKKYFFIHFYYT